MTATALRLDLEATRGRTRWTMTVSFIVHALILLWLVLQPAARRADPPITEITLLEPGDLAPAGADAAPAPAPAGRADETGVTSTSMRDTRFVRLERRADLEPAPQSADAIADAINARLATANRPITASITGAATTSIPASLFGSGPATAPSAGGGGAIALRHGGGGGGGPALNLHRGGTGTGYAPALVATTPGGGSAPASAPARESESTARREVAGASLAGPIADRAVLEHPLPAYPDWAKKEAVEGSVTIYFVVRPDGGVKENVLIQKTAGFSDFDDNARTALRAWQFEPLRGGRTGEQWGTITFHFRLRDAG
jgi:TonB family protein